MEGNTLTPNGLELDEAELARLGRIADRLLAGRPVFPHGTTPHRTRAGRGLEFLELRPYVVGDDLRDIDWRGTARSRYPVIRRYRDEAFSIVYLCMDRSSSMATDDTAKWRLAFQVAAGFAYLALHAGNRVGVLAFSANATVVHPPVRGRGGYARLVASLAGTQIESRGSTTRLEACARFLSPHASAVVLSDFLAPDGLTPGMQALLRRCRSVQAFRILSPSDTRVPAIGLAQLCDVESGERRSLRLTAEVRGQALRRLSQGQEDLAAFCLAHGIPLTLCETGTSWGSVLLAHLRALWRAHA